MLFLLKLVVFYAKLPEGDGDSLVVLCRGGLLPIAALSTIKWGTYPIYDWLVGWLIG
jgi:hypothetical protein